MKRVFVLCLLFALLLPAPRAAAQEPLRDAALPIAAPSAILMEKETGQILYEKNADARQAPASVTKVMTLLLLMEDLDAGRLSPEDIVTASSRAASFGGSCVFLEPGEQMSVHEMLKCIAVVSANDCAVAMAEHVSGTEELFVARMNARAEELGLENTHFTNCTGLFDDPEHYSTARDIAIMSRELIRHERIKEYSTIWMDSIRGGSFELSNTNKLVYWYPGCTGLKTGFTNSAMYCLSATAEREGVEYIAVIMHGESIDSRNDDAMTLLNYAFANFTLCPLTPEDALPCLPVEMGRQDSLPLRLDGPDVALVSKGGAAPYYELTLPEQISAPVHAGQVLGTLRVTRGEQTLAERAVLADADVERIGFGGIFLRLAASLFGSETLP